MKKLPFAFLLMFAPVLGSSFTEEEEIITDEAVLFQIKNGYAIRIDGFGFDAREKNSVTASLADRNGTITTALTFWGNNTKTKDGGTNPQRIDIDFAFNEGKIGNIAVNKLQFEFNKQKFYHLPEETNFNIKSITWSSDHKSFNMTADFDCKVRKVFASDGNTPILNIKGKIENLRVEVPAVVFEKLPNTSASL